MHNQAEWQGITSIKAHQYRCAYCNASVASAKGWTTNLPTQTWLCVCPLCLRPTFFDSERQTPATKMGEQVKGLPPDVAALYDEARRCTGAGAYTSAVLSCRKILMHVAVEQGAAENLKFAEYVDHLQATGYVPPNGKAWVDQIRKKGNEATHEIVMMSEREASDVLGFLQYLLKFVYEFPSMVPNK